MYGESLGLTVLSICSSRIHCGAHSCVDFMLLVGSVVYFSFLGASSLQLGASKLSLVVAEKPLGKLFLTGGKS
ncbi:hypothetical protein BVC80_8763g5 [Macleaya cordata]|uniref:Uncharacterized protein n=1 Tax=Macleaya cordata TaxID=56857 RepID=A0A200QNC1_MACCD|nr:hypothetical protein BVC80_8763g5 [Macleaya cordata]